MARSDIPDGVKTMMRFEFEEARESFVKQFPSYMEDVSTWQAKDFAAIISFVIPTIGWLRVLEGTAATNYPLLDAFVNELASNTIPDDNRNLFAANAFGRDWGLKVELVRMVESFKSGRQ